MWLEQMHLTPVKGTVQLRPNFNYYDTAVGGERRKKFQSEDGPAKQPRAVHVTPLCTRHRVTNFSHK